MAKAVFSGKKRVRHPVCYRTDRTKPVAQASAFRPPEPADCASASRPAGSVDHSSMGAPPVPADFKLELRAVFDGLFILSGGFERASAEQALLDKRGDLLAFGRPFLANPDFAARMRKDAPLNAPDTATFYVPGAKGYTDYPAQMA